MFHLCKVNQIPGSKELLIVESGILGFGIWKKDSLEKWNLRTFQGFPLKFKDFSRLCES